LCVCVCVCDTQHTACESAYPVICKMCCTIWLGLGQVYGLGLVRMRVGLELGSGSGFHQKFTNCACVISKLHSPFCKFRISVRIVTDAVQ